MTVLKTLICAMACLMTTASFAIDLQGTVFERAGKKYQIDPVLLYSIAIVESAVNSNSEGQTIEPYPFAIRTDRPYYPRSREEAEKMLKKLLRKNRSVDVGLCQINTLWHGHRVARIYDLLDPQVNVNVAAKILSECIERHPNDAVAAIGSYHSTNRDRSDNYAKYVLRVYTKIKEERQ